jgi:hypothetical protein
VLGKTSRSGAGPSGTSSPPRTRRAFPARAARDGKTANAQHVLALDSFTLAVLRAHVDMLDQERKDFGPDYHDRGWLFCWENGLGHVSVTFTNPFTNHKQKAGSLFENRPLPW